MSEYDCTPSVLAERIRREGTLGLALRFDGDAIEMLDEALILCLEGQHPHTLRNALLAQIEVSTRMMRKLGFTDQEIADSTAQARAALAVMDDQRGVKP